MERFVVYARVSTARQGESGLGLEAQLEAARRIAADRGAIVGAPFVEVESGKNDDRPELAAALKACRAKRATLLIARIDRLARNLRFIAEILDSGVEIVCADMPIKNRMALQMRAVFAEEEHRLISERTKAALAAAKARGVALGGHRNPTLATQAKAASAAAKRSREATARQYAETLREAIGDLRSELPDPTQSALAEALNARGFRSPRGGEIRQSVVSRALAAGA